MGAGNYGYKITLLKTKKFRHKKIYIYIYIGINVIKILVGKQLDMKHDGGGTWSNSVTLQTKYNIKRHDVTVKINKCANHPFHP